MRKILYVIILIVCFSVGYFLPEVSAQPKPTWIMKSCFTLDEVTSVLNALSPEQAASAKVTTINSQRSMLGALSSPYYVWYHNTPKR